jgi:hypothetical protein
LDGHVGFRSRREQCQICFDGEPEITSKADRATNIEPGTLPSFAEDTGQLQTVRRKNMTRYPGTHLAGSKNQNSASTFHNANIRSIPT